MMPTLGDRLRRARTAKGLTHEQVAEKAGHKKGWYTKLENNRRSPKWADIVEVAGALDVSLDHLAHGGALIDRETWARFQHLSVEVQAQVAQLIITLSDREILLRVAGKSD